MTQFVDVVEVNPILFVKSIVEQIHNGFHVQNSIVGYPVVGLPYQIRLFDGAAPTIRNKMPDEIHTAVVEGYDMMLWLLDVQDLAVQGFEVQTEVAVVDNFKSVTMIRRAPASLAGLTAVEEVVEPAAKPATKTKRAPKATKTTVEGE